ncbi:MAG TPA: hypothetical protein PLT66_08375 [Bacillota bacterium]|nr:hypothetical protein [Bacillota bacterium]
MKSGDLVISLAGRDKGRILVVTQVVDDAFVNVADGKVRRAEKPKLKKTKHIRPVTDCDKRILELPVEKLTNRCIREKISAYTESKDKTADVIQAKEKE